MAPRKSAAAAARSWATTSGTKKTFSFSQVESAITKSPGKSPMRRENDYPHCSIRATFYQKGPLEGQPSGNRQVLFRSRFSLRAEAMAALEGYFLTEKNHWQPELKPDGKPVYAVKVSTLAQARKILTALREVEGPEMSEQYLPEDFTAQDFEGAKQAHIDIVPIDDKMMLHGLTFPLLDKLKAIGFEFDRGLNHNDAPAPFDAWTISAAAFNAGGRGDLIELLDIWGWTYDIYDAQLEIEM